MTREDYERRKQRLEEQLRAGIELLESACRAQVRALDLVWMLQAEEAGPAGGGEGALAPVRAGAAAPAKQEAVARPAVSRRRRAPEVADDVRGLLFRLPENFTRGDVCDLLGYEPNRGILYRILTELVKEGSLVIEEKGAGNRATVYRRTSTAVSPTPE